MATFDFTSPAIFKGALSRGLEPLTLRPETELVPELIANARVDDATAERTKTLATNLVMALRGKARRGLVEELLQRFSLSSEEGVALMCLAEALLRIPDNGTRDRLIRDKVGGQDWEPHTGRPGTLFAHAATWALLVTGRLTAPTAPESLHNTLRGVVARLGEPVVRAGVATMMRLLGDQFVRGETIEKALERSRSLVAQGFSYSYDMLGEAALSAADAAHYFGKYEEAIHAIGRAASRAGVKAGPGISIKLSALHPRYQVAQSERVMAELLPSVRQLCMLACHYDIGLNIDAEEADRLELSLDLLDALALDPALAGWHGLGFVVQAYGRRAYAAIEHLVRLAERSGHRLMIRLVKGAYWDSEIKRAQAAGLESFPVFTRKVYTDLSYLACAKLLLASRNLVFPQFATHNAQTVAAIYSMAGPDFTLGDYEFQCLHGMGEPLYQEVVGPGRIHRPCRIYAPVGTHELLLAYLVRRLLENGANSSFVNRVADPNTAIAALVEDPVALAASIEPIGAPNPRIVEPPDLFLDRQNAAGLNLADARTLVALGAARVDQAQSASPMLAKPSGLARQSRPVVNPADPKDVVGQCADALPGDIESAVTAAEAAASSWAAVPEGERALLLERVADLYGDCRDELLWLLVREAGKTMANAAGEWREAVDFLRYYAAQIRSSKHQGAQPLGPVVAISPWNFPLAIFTGQIAAALAAGNPVLAKPAEETPLVASKAVLLFHLAGIPNSVLQLLPGAGDVGAGLVADPRVCAVVFTGSLEVARHINTAIAQRLTPEGIAVRLIAETGGMNAMLVDSSALPEQVVADVLTSGFDSAGQRCSALRLLLVQEDIYEMLRNRLTAAMAEMQVGDPARLSADIGPIISGGARDQIAAHVESMRTRGFAVHQSSRMDDAAGHFFPLTLIEVDSIADVPGEIFGPVVHMLRWKAGTLESTIAAVNATGFGLTFGLHTRLDSTVSAAVANSNSGNIYINRNMIGAVVGSQPFGGRFLSGTGPKAGGPLYLSRLLRSGAAEMPIDYVVSLPAGEVNAYQIAAHQRTLVVATSPAGHEAQMHAIAAAGGTPLFTADWDAATFDSVLIEAEGDALVVYLQRLAARPGPIPLVQALTPSAIAAGARYDPRFLVSERVISTNTTAAGGNATLMAMDG